MLRHLIAILITAYAIAFAFGALTAVRWPSIMLLLGLAMETDAGVGLDSVNWRELGIAYGGPYLLAALCFYASALMVSKRLNGAFSWFMMACVAGFPCAFLVDFEAGWWRDPSPAEGAVAGGFVAAALLAVAVWDLRKRKPKAKPDAIPAPIVLAPAQMAAAPVSAAKPRRRGPVPAAIARQRASFAKEGQKMMARRRR